MTRGAFTTFSIANDVAKYFAIIPAAFVTTYPQLNALNVMRLASPYSAILAAVIFNALIIVALIPLALKGVRYRPLGAATLLRRNPRRDHRAVPRHQADRHSAGADAPRLSLEVAAHELTFPQQAAGGIITRDGHAVGSRLIGQSFSEPRYFWSRPSATTPQPYNGAASTGSNLGPLDPALLDAVKARVAALRAADPGNRSPVPVDLVTASGSGLDPEISVAAANYQTVRVACARTRSRARGGLDCAAYGG